MGHNCAPAHQHRSEPMTWRGANRAFIDHARSYMAVNLLLVVIWLMTTPGHYFWPMWPMLGWGIGLLAHAMATFNRSWALDELD
jgi:hypothetical protein